MIPSPQLAEAATEHIEPTTDEAIEGFACRFRVATTAMGVKLQMIRGGFDCEFE